MTAHILNEEEEIETAAETLISKLQAAQQSTPVLHPRKINQDFL